MISLSQVSVKLAHRVFTAEQVAFVNRVNFVDRIDDVVVHYVAFAFWFNGLLWGRISSTYYIF